MTIIVLGSVNSDLVVRVPRLPRPGETVLGGEFLRSAGGKGANQAVAAARAGNGPVVFLAAIGDDEFGRQSLVGLEGEGIDCRWIRVMPGIATGVALIMVDASGENLISVASGANLHLAPQQIDQVPEETFSEARVLLASLETPPDAVERGLARARQAGAMTILNPAPALALERAGPLLRLADVVTPNEHEAAALAEMPVTDSSSAAAAARAMQARGAGHVVVTLGSDGCVVCALDSAPVAIPARSAQAVDTTAAGDAFSGALALALSEGKSLPDSAQFATIAASIAVTRVGAQPSLPRRVEINGLFSRVC